MLFALSIGGRTRVLFLDHTLYRGEREGEHRATAQLALHPDPSTMRLDDAFGDRQAQAGSGPARVRCLPETVEEVPDLVGRDPRPRVRHGEDDLVSADLGRDTDGAALGRE